ncbi:helix-turn-helix domain-containing protein [Neobacillus vireti]|uniref:helix-turn-helix domain-containing protein n=1 Tax=Neobacillus vireti TaxID=220686 RepID=UPI002FFDADC3
MKHNLNALSIFCLAISIVIGSYLISNSLSKNSLSVPTQTSSQSTNKLFTEPELASYLGLSLDEVKKLGPISDSQGGIEGVLPYLIVGGKVYYSKAAIDKWLLNNQGYRVQ